MRDREWRLVDSGGTDLTFGPPDLPIVNLSAPDLGAPELRVDDVDRARSDGTAFGVDYRGGRTVAFDLGVFGATEFEARDTLAALSVAWRGDYVRARAERLARLHVQYAGRERIIYGRPRRFAASEELIDQGVAHVTADFVAASDLYFDATEQVETVTFVPALGGGLMAPLAFPLTSTQSSDRSGALTVGGNVPAYPVISINGPITNPTVEVVGLWTMTFETTLLDGQVLTVDTRPWSRTATLNGGGSRAGALTRSSPRISEATVPPGTHEVVLRGLDATGSSFLHFAWRNAFTSL